MAKKENLDCVLQRVFPFQQLVQQGPLGIPDHGHVSFTGVRLDNCLNSITQRRNVGAVATDVQVPRPHVRIGHTEGERLFEGVQQAASRAGNVRRRCIAKATGTPPGPLLKLLLVGEAVFYKERTCCSLALPSSSTSLRFDKRR
jgi:hypothetical protein